VGKAQVNKAKADIQAIETGLTLYRLDNFKFPSTDLGLNALVQRPNDPTVRHWREGGYLRRISADPWAIRTSTFSRERMALNTISLLSG
jgi:general secretion pathway protein G